MELPSMGKLSISRTTVTQESFLPVTKRARTTSCSSNDSAIYDDQHFAAVKTDLITRSPRQTSSTLSPAAWPNANALPTSTSMARPRRLRVFGRQDWQDHAMREADGSWRCTWTEDELTCTYKSKKQATKRHIELKHMKMKYYLCYNHKNCLTHIVTRPHLCCYCERTFGQVRPFQC